MTIKYLDSKRISASTSDYPLGTNNGTVFADWDYIKYGGSVDFDGSNDNIKFGNNTDWNFLHNGGSWTVSFWMKPDNTSDRMVFNTNATTNTNIGIQSILTSGNLRTRIGNGSGDWVTVTKSSFSVNTWYFVVITFDGTTLSVKSSAYAGSLSSATTGTASGSPSSANSLDEMTLGSASDSNTTYPFDGHLTMFMIWDRVLTSTEINTLHGSGSGSTSYSESGLVLRTCLQITGESLQWFDNQVLKPTNVQDNSILVERDTGKRYWFDASSDFDFSASTAGGVSNQPADATEVGQLITSTTHRGKKAKSATFSMAKVGSPSGTMVYKIRKSSDNSVVATSTGTSVSALSTSITAVTLNFNDEVIPNEDIRVTVSGGTGSAPNAINIRGGGSDVVSGQTLTSWNGSAWAEYSNDCAGKLTFTESWTLESPVTLPLGLTIWYDFSDVSTITKDSSNRISVVADKTSNGFDLVQATGGAQPLWVAGDKNSLGVIDFAGSRYMASTFASMSNTTGYSIVLACVVPADNNTSMFSSTSPTSAKLRTYNTGTLALENLGVVTTSPVISGLNGSWHTIVCIGNDTSSKVYIDGTLMGTGDMDANLVNWLVGAESTSGGYSNAKQGELIAYNRVLSATEISDLHTYLKKKWGIYIN